MYSDVAANNERKKCERERCWIYMMCVCVYILLGFGFYVWMNHANSIFDLVVLYYNRIVWTFLLRFFFCNLCATR